MVERTAQLDHVFQSLSDPTRRDILKRLSRRSMSVGEIAERYPMSMAAVAKHVSVLHRARLVSKERRGKEQVVRIAPTAFAAASNYLDTYKELWEQRLDKLDRFLQTQNKKGEK